MYIEYDQDRIKYIRDNLQILKSHDTLLRAIPSYHNPFSSLNLSQASFNVLNTAPAIILCSVVAVIGSWTGVSLVFDPMVSSCSSL